MWCYWYLSVKISIHVSSRGQLNLSISTDKSSPHTALKTFPHVSFPEFSGVWQNSLIFFLQKGDNIYWSLQYVKLKKMDFLRIIAIFLNLSFKNIFLFQQYHICLKLSNKPVLVISSYKLQQFKPSEEPVSITHQKVLLRYWPHSTGIFYHNTIGLICWLLGLFSGRYFLKLLFHPHMNTSGKFNINLFFLKLIWVIDVK